MDDLPALMFTYSMASLQSLHRIINQFLPKSRSPPPSLLSDPSSNLTSNEDTGQPQDKPPTMPSIQPLTLVSLPSMLTTWASRQW